MSKKVVLIGSLDTKGIEYAFVRDILHQSGVETLTINTGVLNAPYFTPDITSDEVAAAGGATLSSLQNEQDRGKAVSTMTKGVAVIVSKLIEENVVGALFGMGGTAGTTVCASAMQAAPIGIPKLLVSTVAS
ncbi:MAG: Tm-1-like ATP-binding domain-containing protein, partial [Bacilli bacterium]